MLALILSILGGAGTWFLCHGMWPEHYVWDTLLGILGFIVVTLLINLAIRKRMEAAFGKIQSHILERQTVINRKIKGVGMHATPRFQEQIEAEQAEILREAVVLVDDLKPFAKWNLMVKKQINTLKAQFYFQLKEYEKADEYFKGALMFDPMLMAMQMARYYKLGKMDQMATAFKKGAARFKDEKGVIIYALYSWALVQKNKIDEAIQVLVQAKTKAEHEVLKQNWDHLVNGRVKRFSNAGLGEQWYALYLESPRALRMRGEPGGFGNAVRRH